MVKGVQELGSSFYLFKSARNLKSSLEEIKQALSSYDPSSVALLESIVKNPTQKEVRFSEGINAIQINVEMKTLADSLKAFTTGMTQLYTLTYAFPSLVKCIFKL